MSDEVLAAGRFLTLLRRGRWEFVDRTKSPTAVMIVAVTEDDEVLLIEQFRVPVGKRVIEFPAGIVGDDGDYDLKRAAIRELEEETGYRADAVEELFTGPPSAGLSTELITVYRATGVKKESDNIGVDGEELTRHVVPWAEVASFLEAKIAGGCVVDPKLYGGLWWLERAR